MDSSAAGFKQLTSLTSEHLVS